MSAALLLGAQLSQSAFAQPPFLPWKIENDNLVSGLASFPHPCVHPPVFLF
jgi:hypothetical protein